MKILANDGISASGINQLENSGFEVITEKVNQSDLIEFINNQKIEVILVRSATQIRKDIIDNCSSIKIIGRGGVGMDNIDVNYAKEKGIEVINTPRSHISNSQEKNMVKEKEFFLCLQFIIIIKKRAYMKQKLLQDFGL